MSSIPERHHLRSASSCGSVTSGPCGTISSGPSVASNPPSRLTTHDEVVPTHCTTTSTGGTSVETPRIEEHGLGWPIRQESDASDGLSLPDVNEVIILSPLEEEEERPLGLPLMDPAAVEDSEYTPPTWYPGSFIGDEVLASDPTYHERLQKPVPPRKALPELAEDIEGDSDASSLGPDCPMSPPPYPDGEPESSDGEPEEGNLDNLVPLLTRVWPVQSDDDSEEDDTDLPADSADSIARSSIDEENNLQAGTTIFLKRKRSADGLEGSSNS